MIVIYPQAIWYGGVRIKDVPRIVEETIVGGSRVERRASAQVLAAGDRLVSLERDLVRRAPALGPRR